MQAMYDLVGDKIQEIFDAQVVDIAIYDRGRRRLPLPVHDRAGRPFPDESDPVPRLPEARPSRPVATCWSTRTSTMR